MAEEPYDRLDGVIWYDGKLVPWSDATMHVLSHGLHYGSCVFEGERASLEVGVWDPDPAIVLRVGDQKLSLSGQARAKGGGPLTFHDVFVRQIDDFAAAIREKREPLVPGREGRRSLDLIEACYASRQPLEMPWDEPAELAGWRP